MDPQEYDRIADLLMQIRKKYNKLPVNDADMKISRRRMIDSIDYLIENNDIFAQWDSKGWL